MEKNIETLLNSDILGGSNQASRERVFYRVNLEPPRYSPGFFETSPTMWAAAYDFEQKIRAGDTHSVEEWASLILLHFCRRIHVVNYDEKALEDGLYDPDLWPVLSRTWPKAEVRPLEHLGILLTSDNKVIGGSYPSVIFFPGRGRAGWAETAVEPYLDDADQTSLSWKKCFKLLDDEDVRDKFRRRLGEVLALLPAQKPNTRSPLAAFCKAALGLDTTSVLGPSTAGQLPTLSRDPSAWPVLNDDKTSRDFLDEYPFVREDEKGIRTYYFVEGMPAAPDDWMTRPIGLAKPSPAQFRYKDEKVIVDFNKGDECQLAANERVVQLKSCFIESSAYCGVPDAEHIPAVNELHRELNNGKGLHSRVHEGSRSLVVWLAPISREFIAQFPELVENPATIRKVSETADEVTWRFPIQGHTIEKAGTRKRSEPFEVIWKTKPFASKTLTNLGIAIWPPDTDKEWSLYAAYGTAGFYEENRQMRKAERWVIVGDQGVSNNLVELDPEPSANWVSILEGKGKPNIPRGLLLLSKEGRDAGAVFLKPSPSTGQPVTEASLSVDFGTSNTCVAYKLKNESDEPEPLTFSLVPRLLWGSLEDYKVAATPGFVPFEWGADEGVYPSVLLRKKEGWGAEGFSKVKDCVKVDHLWRAAIPALYRERAVVDALYLDKYRNWVIHDDMKWNDNPEDRSARLLFLGRSLLYACAELFFRKNRGAKVETLWFTFPLVFTDPEAKGFKDTCTVVADMIREFCYTTPKKGGTDIVSESRAVASYDKDQKPNIQSLELFIDTGGGTTDLALRHDKDYLVLDSIKVAGAEFFRFAEKNLEKGNKLRGAAKFSQHLARLLQFKENGEELSLPESTRLKPYYSLLINRYDTESFNTREQQILAARMGEKVTGETESRSFQRYRTELFFKHILAYGLLQACAAAADNNRALAVPGDKLRIDLTLGGNAWGLMMFGGLTRSAEKLQKTANAILDLIRSKLKPALSKDEAQCLEKLVIGTVNLLNQDRLSDAKTAVAVGALRAAGPSTGIAQAAAYSGVNLTQLTAKKGIRSDDVRWCDHWTRLVLLQKTGQGEESGSLEKLAFSTPGRIDGPLHQAASVFVSLGADEKDLPERNWININSLFSTPENFASSEDLVSPINYFLSYIYGGEDVLNELARLTENFEKPALAALR
jgi:hypothetical protein